MNAPPIQTEFKAATVGEILALAQDGYGVEDIMVKLRLGKDWRPLVRRIVLEKK